MRAKHSVLILVAAALLAPAFLWSQGPGGGPGGRGRFGPGGFDPNAIFDRMSKGKNVLVRSELDERGQGFFDRIARQLNITNGQITRDQFQQVSQQWAQMRANGGWRRPGEQGVVITPPGGGSGGNPVDQQAEFVFRRADKNNDGMLSFEEMSERLQSERDKWDTNKDGFIDLSEFKPYFASRMAAGPDAVNSEVKPNGQPWAPGADPTLLPSQPQPEEEERRPVVIRVGKLPKELPAWWNELDTDEDGQIGLYEWRRGGKPIPEFLELDLNGDGLLTAEEYLKAMKVAKEAAAKASPRAAGVTPGQSPGVGPGPGLGAGPPPGGLSRPGGGDGGRQWGPPGDRGRAPDGGDQARPRGPGGRRSDSRR